MCGAGEEYGVHFDVRIRPCSCVCMCVCVYIRAFLGIHNVHIYSVHFTLHVCACTFFFFVCLYIYRDDLRLFVYTCALLGMFQFTVG